MKKHLFIAFVSIVSVQLSAQKVKFGKITKEELQEKIHPLDALAEAAYLYKNKEVFIEYTSRNGWSLVTVVHERIKIYKKDAAQYATEEIRLFKRGGTDEEVNGLKAYTYNLVAGKIKKEKLQKSHIFENKTSKNWYSKKFTMPNVKEGSIVEYTYRKVSPYFQHIDKFDLQHSIPINKLSVLVKIPEYFKYKTHSQGYLQMYFKEFFKNKKIRYSYRSDGANVGGNTTKYEESIDLSYKHYELSKENIPAIESKESYISSINNYKSSIKFELNSILMPRVQPQYFATSWDAVARRIYKTAAFGEELQKSNYYKTDLETLLNGKTSEFEKAAAIFQFVKSKMKWNGITGKYTNKGVRKAYKEQVGNVAEINLLLTSMMRSAGLNANPVLVSTRANGTPMYPTIQGFNYVVSSVAFSDNSFALFDATAPYSLPNLMPVRTINWNGRLVKKDGTSIAVNLVPTKHSIHDVNINVKLTSDGLINGLMRSKFTNYNAYGYRVQKNHVKDAEVRKSIEEKNNIEIENFRISNKLKIGKPINELVKFTSEDLVEEIGDKLYIEPLLFRANKANPFKLNERKFPVDFNAPWMDKNTISIQIPEGYTVASIPETTAISMADNLGVFKFQVTQVGNKIKTMSVVQINKAIITPEYYQELKEFYNRMVKKQTEKIVLVKK